MSESQLTQRLHRLRGIIRRRLLGYGVCAVLAGGVVAFLAIVSLDWFLHLPPIPRIIAAVIFLIGFLGACLHWIIRPLRLRLGNDELAARLEMHFGSLHDRLSSSVNFLESETGDHKHRGSQRMVQQVISNTERLISNLSFSSALSLRPLALRALVLAASLATLGIIALVSPGWVQTGLYRYVHPLREIEWPRRVAILPLTSDQIVAVGESVTVRMRVQRGLTPSLRSVVHLRELGGQTISLAMQREQIESEGVPSDTFYAVVDAVASDLTYWFSAGDADTIRTPYSLRVIRRPQIMEVLATVEPPTYAPSAPSRVHDPNDGPIRVPSGGFVRLSVRSSKVTATHDGTGLRTTAGKLIPFIADSEDVRKLSCRFQVDSDLHFRVELHDTDGFENRGAPQYSILATPDLPPTVTILEPRAVEELTAGGSIESVVHAEDDFGIEDLHLDITRPGNESSTLLPLSDTLTPEAARQDYTDRHHISVLARLTWRLEDTNVGTLAPGDMITYTAVAHDNRLSEAGQGQIGRSQVMRIRIISQTEFDTRLRSDLAALETKVRQSLLDQTAILDATTSLHAPESGDTPLTAQQRSTASTLAGAQTRIVRRLRDLAARFDRLAQRVGRNLSGESIRQARIATLGKTLQEVASLPMTEASTALHDTAKSTDPATQQFALRDAATLQTQAVRHLQSVLQAMSQWGSFQELFSKTRDLLDRQEEVRRETLDAGDAMLGKRIDTLTESQSAALKRTQRKQEQLLKEVEQLLATMAKQADTTRDKDATTSDALDATIRAARAHETTRHMKDAAAGLAENRTAAAGIAQHAATKALHKMIVALRERETHRLEELRKQLTRIEDLVAGLIEEQQGLRDATHEAGLMDIEENAYRDLAGSQRLLKRNAQLLGDQLIEDERATPNSSGIGPAARLVQRTGVPMGQAESELNEFRATQATISQDEALSLLHEALEALEQLALQAEEQMLRRSLGQIREHLEATLTAQRFVNEGISDLRKAITANGRITRKEARTASKLARAQAETRTMIDAHRDDFEKVVVYHWALQRVTQWMETSRRGLSDRQINDDLVSTTDRIVAELRQLLQALADTESLPVDSSFVESESGGGRGAGPSAAMQAIPKVAELLLLKSMQARINKRTKELSAGLGTTELTEEQLRMLKTVGEDQGQVQRLTEMITERSQHP